MKLDIGSGRSPVAGCTTVDLFEAADICAPFWEIPLPKDCAEEIHSSYTLEHVPVFRAVDALKEWKRILKPDGFIIVKVPDFLWVCQYFLSAPGPGWSMTLVFGPQNEWGELHKSGWTEQMVRDICKEVGLFVVQFERVFEHEMWVLKFTLTKTENIIAPAPIPQPVPRTIAAKPVRPWRTS